MCVPRPGRRGHQGANLAVDVLLVEDLKNIQSAMVQMLQGLGDFRIAAALSTEAEALDWLEELSLIHI